MRCSRPHKWAVLYLIALALAVCVGWYLAASDYVSFEVSGSKLLDHHGNPQNSYRAGDEVRIQRDYCVSGKTEFEFFPTLIDSKGTVFPLVSGVFAAGGGCKTASYGFVVPDLPPGAYTLRSTITYQNGPLNQDTTLVLPKLIFEVRP